MAGPSGRGGIVQDTLAPTEMPNAVAAPVDTFTQVTKTQSPGAMFLDGLGKLAKPATDTLVAFDQQAGDQAEAAANLKALQVPPEELRQEIASGNYFGMAHRRAQAALRIMDAGNRVNDLNLQLAGMNAKGELVGPDTSGKIGLLVGQHAEGVAGDPLAEKVFAQGVLPVIRKYSNDAYANNVANEQQNTAARLTEFMRSRHDVIDSNADAAGVKGNNPGNIEASTWAKGRPGYAGRRGEDGRFAFFDSAASGYRAANDLLNNYASKGIVTPAAIIAKWAPPSDGNDVKSYVASIVKGTGLDPNKPLPNDTASRAAFLTAMTKVEHGKSPYSPGQVKEWLEGGNAAPDDLTTQHKRAMFASADLAKNGLLMSPEQIEKAMTVLVQHYAQAGNVAAVDAIGAFDRNGAPLRDRYSAQFDAWRKQAEQVSDAAVKRAANSDADGLEAMARRGDTSPADYNRAVDLALTKRPEDFGAARAERLKALNLQVAAQKQADAIKAMSAQQEAQTRRHYIETSADALGRGEGYTIPAMTKFTTPDGVEHVVKREDAVADGYKRKEAVLDEQAKEGNWAPEDLLRAKTRLYSMNGDVHPVFQQSFNDLFSSSRAGVPANPNTLPQRLSQLEFLRTNDPNQFMNLAGSGKDGKQHGLWLATFNAARDQGIEPERAFAVANQRVFNPSAIDRTISNADMQSKVEDVMKQWSAKGWFGTGLGAGAGVLPSAQARKVAEGVVQLQISAGTSDTDIVSKAVADLTRNRIVVNGMPVHSNLPGVGDPSVAAEYLSDAATYYKKSTPGLRDVDIAIGDDPARNGNYTVYDMSTGYRISRPGTPDSSISGSRLIDFVMQMRERERTEKTTAAESYEKLKATTPTSLPEPTDEELRAIGKQRRRALGNALRKIGGEHDPNAVPNERELRTGD